MDLVSKREVVIKRKLTFQVSEDMCKAVEKLQHRVKESNDIDLFLDEAIEVSLKKLVTKANKELDEIEKTNGKNSHSE